MYNTANVSQYIQSYKQRMSNLQQVTTKQAKNSRILDVVVEEIAGPFIKDDNKFFNKLYN